ncbi:unnamed protein product [Urochloa humidicola]
MTPATSVIAGDAPAAAVSGRAPAPVVSPQSEAARGRAPLRVANSRSLLASCLRECRTRSRPPHALRRAPEQRPPTLSLVVAPLLQAGAAASPHAGATTSAWVALPRRWMRRLGAARSPTTAEAELAPPAAGTLPRRLPAAAPGH